MFFFSNSSPISYTGKDKATVGRKVDTQGLVCTWADDAERHGLTTFLSAEAVWRHLKGAGDWIEKRRSYLEDLRKSLSRFDVTAIVVLRRQDRFAESLYKEHVLRGIKSGAFPFADFVADQKGKMLRFYENIALLEEIMGEVRVLVYEDLQHGGADLPGAFMEEIGVDATGLQRVGRVRQSLDVRQTLAKAYLNTLRRKEGDRQAADYIRSDRLREILEQEMPSNVGLWPSEKHRAEFIARYHEENEDIRRRWLPEREKLFSASEESQISHELPDTVKKEIRQWAERTHPLLSGGRR
jgi:hypothetical protein